jgi:DNA polymerase III alpha subunit (gram-positive type)
MTMKPNLANVLYLDFEFETFDTDRYVWQVGGLISMPTENHEFQYDVSLVKGQGLSQEEGLLRLLGILERYKVNVIACHNAAAERSVLEAWCSRLNYEMPKITWVDTLKLSRQLIRRGKGYDLPTLLKRLGIDQGGEAHTALPDARGCAMLLERLLLIRAGKIPMPI